MRCLTTLTRTGIGLVAVALLLTAGAGARMVVENEARLSDLRMVKVVVEVYEVSHTDGSALGVDWRWRKRTTSAADLLDSVAKFPINFDQQGNLTFSVLDLKQGVLTATLNAAMERGNARLLSRPTVTTRDGEQVTVSSGEEIPFTVLSTIANNLPQNLVTQYRQTGVTLDVTPRILPPATRIAEDGTEIPVQKIALKLRPQVSDIMRFDRLEVNMNGTAKIYDLPVVSQRNVETIVIVREGQTLVLGGLLEERYDEREQGVPYLKSIPVLGNAFKTTDRKSLTNEVIMYVTPQIVDPGKEFIENRDERLARLNTGESTIRPEPTPVERDERTSPMESMVAVTGTRTFVETGGKKPFLGRNNRIIATGHVENRSSRDITELQLEAALYDDLGELKDVVTENIGSLRSGQERPFRLSFENFDENFNNTYIAHRVEYKTYFNY